MSEVMEAGFGSGRAIDVAPRMALLFNGLSIAAVTLATLLPMGTALYWLFIDPVEVRNMVGLAPDLLPDITMGQRLAAAAVVLLVTLPMAWGLMRLRSCLSSFAVGRPFASTGIAGLRDFAMGGMLAALAQFAGHTLLRLVLTWTAAPGHRQLAISIDSTTLMLAMFAGTIAALAWAMEKAAAIAEENSQFI
ncbi:MAG: hypothetical protein ACO1O4_17950 [Devosia sp.]